MSARATPRNAARPHAASAVGAVAGVVWSLAIFALAGGGVLTHANCRSTGASVPTFGAWVPALLINSPYGGEAFGNGTVPLGSLSIPGLGTVYELGEATAARLGPASGPRSM